MNREELIKTEHLCNIKVEDNKKEIIASQITDILQNIKKLYEIETKDDFYRPHEIVFEELRSDMSIVFGDTDKLLGSAISVDGRFVVVPKIIGGDNDR